MGPKTGDRVRWIPNRPTPGFPNQELSWGDGYWKRTINKARGTAQRYDFRGNPVSAENAHTQPQRLPKSGPGSRCFRLATGAVLATAAGTADGMNSLASNGAYKRMADAARRGDLTDDMVFDESINAATDTGDVGAFYGINSGWSWSKSWNDLKNWISGK